jgi:hypothetical protein
VPPTNKVGSTIDLGYRWVWVPQHPRARRNGYVKVAWLVLERRLGRYLRRGEETHHINGDKLDDRDENLEVISHREHARRHSKARRRTLRGTWEG